MINFIPAPNRVLIEQFREPEKKGSLYIPENQRKFSNRGKIVKVGKEVEGKPQLYKEGMTVIYPATSQSLQLDDDDLLETSKRKSYVLVNQFDIYGELQE